RGILSQTTRISVRSATVVLPHWKIMISLKKSVTLTARKYLNALFMPVAPVHMAISNLTGRQVTSLFPNIHGQRFFKKKGSKLRFLCVFLRLYMGSTPPRLFGIHAALPLNFIQKTATGI